MRGDTHRDEAAPQLAVLLLNELLWVIMYFVGFPYAAALKNAGYDGSARFPKLYALVERTAKYPSVAAYLKTSQTFYKVLASGDEPW